jgi:uncharacterized protein
VSFTMARKSKSVRRSAVIDNVNDVVYRGITSIMERQSVLNWVGTMTNLTTALNRVLSQRQRTILPGSPSALRLVINRVANRLRSRGIGVRFGRTTDHSRTRFVKFAR